MMLSIAKRSLIWMIVGLSPKAALAEAPTLELPIDCALGVECFVQQFVDHDSGEGARDYTCGGASYDGHRGTDFRIRNKAVLRKGVKILAAAGGRVNAVRDGMADNLVRTEADRAAIKGKDCGNGLIVQHGEGWTTQYCHMKRGSVTRNQGEWVNAGDILGEVGLSGNTQFPHVHLTVRDKKRVVDPFNPDLDENTCSDGSIKSMWSIKSKLRGDYQPTQVFDLGFGDAATSVQALEEGVFQDFTLDKGSPALIGYVRVMNIVAGDRVQATLSGPKGVIAEKTQAPFDRRKAQTMMFVGKKKPKRGWPKGTYRFAVSVLRNGKIIEREAVAMSRN